MRNDVRDWVQEGRLCVWRYAEAKQQWRGWQWSADPAGARSLRNLLDRMEAGGPSYRTLRLEPASDAVLGVPGARHAVAERCEKLRVEYQPGFLDLRLEPDGETLVLTVGDGRLRKLAAALTQVEAGEGDFGLAPSDHKRADHWLFWWMHSVEYHLGKRS